jgi:hypothetical protein
MVAADKVPGRKLCFRVRSVKLAESGPTSQNSLTWDSNASYA